MGQNHCLLHHKRQMGPNSENVVSVLKNNRVEGIQNFPTDQGVGTPIL